MLFVSVSDPEEFSAIDALPLKCIQGVELRLDRFPQSNPDAVRNFLEMSRYPLMLTLRSASHGGSFVGSEREREALMEELLHLEPPFFDLEYDMNSAFLFKVLQKYKKTKIILSYHNFEETPQDLLPIYQAMTRFSAYGYKIATFSRSSNDALRMLVFAKNHDKVSVICMGEKGQFARVLGPVCGNLIDYASLEDGKATAPGQMSVCDLIDVYGYLQRSSHTKLYGLIGDPVEKSLGHLYHNGVFRSKGLDCVYVKMQVASEELAEFFPLATNMGFQGLSVTMPLKEKVIPFLSAIDPSAQSIRAINTLIFRNNQWIGINTDGIGALDAIEKKRSVFEKKIVIIGAGGAARAIVFEALRRGADVCIANRTLQKAQELAREMGCQAVSLSDIPSFYDMLIVCSPVVPNIDEKKVVASALVMDIVYIPRETPFLKLAKSLGCEILYGEEMFFSQAAAQWNGWLV